MVLEARVKSALSGDTVVLSNIAHPSQERILSLAYVSAPRLRREGDEVSIYFASASVSQKKKKKKKGGEPASMLHP